MNREKKSLLGALIGLARAAGDEKELSLAVEKVLIQGTLAAANPNANSDACTLLTEQAHRQKALLKPGCTTCASPCGRTADGDVSCWEQQPERLQGYRHLLLAGAQGLAAALEPAVLKQQPAKGETFEMLLTVLFLLGEDLDEGQLLDTLQKLGAQLKQAI